MGKAVACGGELLLAFRAVGNRAGYGQSGRRLLSMANYDVMSPPAFAMLLDSYACDMHVRVGYVGYSRTRKRF